MLLIKNGFLVTMDAKRSIISDGAILIDQDRITHVGKTDEVRLQAQGAEVVDASHHLVMPGLVNTHNHIFQILMRGLGDDLPLARFVKDIMFPMSKNLRREACKAAGKLAALEMIRSGTTCVRDCHYANADKENVHAIARAIADSGMRGVIGRASMDSPVVPDELRENVDTMNWEFKRFAENWQGKANGRIMVRPEALNEFHTSKEMILAIRELANNLKTGFNMHIAESSSRVDYIRGIYAKGSIEYLSDLGVLGPDVLLDHCVWITDQEIDLIRKHGTKVSHQPISNQFLGDGVAPIRKILNQNITTSVGTDGAATNNNLDMFQVMKAAALQIKVNTLDPAAISAEKVLEMATIGGARALGIENEIGSLEGDKKADLVLVDLKRPEMIPTLKPVSNLVYSATGSCVDFVMVDGEVLMSEQKLSHIDQEKIIEDAEREARALAEST